MSGGNTQRLDKADVAAILKKFLNTCCLPRIKEHYENTIHAQEAAQKKEREKLTRDLLDAFSLHSVVQQPEPLRTLADIEDCMKDINHHDNPFHKKDNELKEIRIANDVEFKTEENNAETRSSEFKKKIEDEIKDNLHVGRLPPPGLPRLSIFKFLAVNIIHVLAYPFFSIRRIFGDDIRDDYRTQMNKLRRQVRQYKRL